MSQGGWVLVAALAIATAFGLYRAMTNGRFRGTHKVSGVQPPHGKHDGRGAHSVHVAIPESQRGPLHDSDVTLGERATLLQFSSAFCAPCRAARRVLSEVAEIVPGVVHVELDAESHLELVRRLGILRTPTTLILDAQGVEVSRASGAPTKDQVMVSLGKSLDP